MMLRAYKKRPKTCKFRVLEYVYGDNKDLREAEQRWLNLIKDEELYWTQNIYNNTAKYYNKKKFSAGGNGSANKGKIRSDETLRKMSEVQKNKIPWNKGKKGLQKSKMKGKNGTFIYSEDLKKRMSEKKKEYWKNKKISDAVYLTEHSIKAPNDLD